MDNYNQTQVNPKLSPLSAVFIIFQIILVLLLVFSIPKILQNDEIKDTPSEGLSATITNASDAIPEEYSDWARMVEWALLDTISENAGEKRLFESRASVNLRKDSIKTQYFEKSDTNYVRAIADIPEYKQSYEVFLMYPSNLSAVNMVEYSNPDVAKPYSILCIKDKTDIIYPDFDCQDSSIYLTRQKIVDKMIDNFDFDYFSAYFDPNDSNRMIISPSVTYNNSEAVKTKYIEETKAAIDSLGIPSNNFTYYVLTAKDVDYYN